MLLFLSRPQDVTLTQLPHMDIAGFPYYILSLQLQTTESMFWTSPALKHPLFKLPALESLAPIKIKEKEHFKVVELFLYRSCVQRASRKSDSNAHSLKAKNHGSLREQLSCELMRHHLGSKYAFILKKKVICETFLCSFFVNGWEKSTALMSIL